jgi:hypothetical protein
MPDWTDHKHDWSIVFLGETPVGISCACGESMALDGGQVLMQANPDNVLRLDEPVHIFYGGQFQGTYRVVTTNRYDELIRPTTLNIELISYNPY